MNFEHLILPGIVFALGLAAEGVTSLRFIQGLNKHPVMREFFGNPTLMSEGSLIDAFPTNKLLCSRDYRACDDPGGVAFCDRHRVTMIAGYGLGWLCIAVAVTGFLLS